MKKYRVGTLICCLFLPLLVGMVSAALSSQGMKAYASMNMPPLSPPAWAFSVAWTALYLMMGLASYYIVLSMGDNNRTIIALSWYGAQLAMNFLWSILFFNWDMYLFAFVWLLAMLCIVIVCAIRFYQISKIGAYLLIPYILWLAFAGYLNLGAYVLNNGVV